MRKAQREALEARSSDLREKLRAYSSPSFDRRVNLREAESLLSSYHVEEIRYFLRAGVFAKPLRGAVKDYLFRRITNGDLTDDRNRRSDGHSR
jgi:hypothetical protein